MTAAETQRWVPAKSMTCAGCRRAATWIAGEPVVGCCDRCLAGVMRDAYARSGHSVPPEATPLVWLDEAAS